MKATLHLLKESALRWNAHNAPRLGAALAYYTVLAVAPLLVVVVAIAGIAFGEDAARGQIVWEIQDVVGRDGANLIQELLKHSQRPAAGIFATMAGVFTLLLGASGVFGELRDSLNYIWDVKPQDGSGLWSAVKYRFFSFAMILGVGFLLLVSLVLSAFLNATGRYFSGRFPAPPHILEALNVVFSLLVIALLFALIYKVVPDTHIPWSDVWIGGAATSVLFTLGKLLIGIYLGKASIGSAYGAAGSLVVLLVWVYYSSQIFLFGAEFTHVYAARRGSRARVPSRPVDERGRMSRAGRKAVTRHGRHPELLT